MGLRLITYTLPNSPMNMTFFPFMKGWVYQQMHIYMYSSIPVDWRSLGASEVSPAKTSNYTTHWRYEYMYN